MSRSAGMLDCVVSAALGDPQPWSSSQQLRIAEWAQSGGRFDVIASMLARPELLDELDVRFFGIGRAVVRCAWIIRPGRDHTQVSEVLNGETRESVFTAVASVEGLSSEMAAMVIAAARGVKPLVILADSSHDDAVRLAALIALATRNKGLVWQFTERVRSALGAVPGACAEVLNVGSNVEVLTLALAVASQEDLERVDGARVVRALVVNMLPEVSSGRSLSWPDGAAISQALTTLQRLVSSCPSASEVLPEVAERIRVLCNAQWSGPPQAAVAAYLSRLDTISLRQPGGRNYDEWAEELRSPDQEVVAAALQQLLRIGSSYSDAGCSYARELVTGAIRGGLSDDLLKIAADALWIRSDKELRALILERPAFRADVAAAFVVGSTSPVETLEVLRASTDFDAALREYLSSGKEIPYRVLRVLDALGDGAVRFFGSVQVKVFTSISSDDHRVASVVAQVSAYIVDRLGDVGARWELFEALASGSDATIDDVLHLVDASL